MSGSYLIWVVLIVVWVLHGVFPFHLLSVGLSVCLLLFHLHLRCFHHLLVNLVSVVSFLVTRCFLLRAGRNLVCVLFQQKCHRTCEQFEGYEFFFVTFSASLKQLLQLLVCWENLHVGEQSLQRLLVDEGLAIRHSLEGCLQIHQLLSSEHLFDGDVLHSEVGSVLLCFLHCFFQQTSWVSQAQLWHTWKFVRVLKVRLFVHFFGIFVVHFSVDASLWLVLDPLANK